MEKMNASQSSVVKCSPLNRGVIGSQGRDSASLSWNCLRNWLLGTLLVGMKHMFVTTKTVYSLDSYLLSTYDESGTLLEADRIVRNKAGKILDFIDLLNTYLRPSYMPETVHGTLWVLNHDCKLIIISHLILPTML